MRFARELYQRFRVLVHEAASFGVVGAIGFVVTIGGSNLLHFQLGVGPTTSMVVATLVATMVTYVGNRYWSFRHRERTNVPREAVTFFVLNGIGILIQTVCLDSVYYLMGLHGKLAYNIALVFGIGLGTLFRFWSYRKWVWAATGTAGPPASDRPAQPGPPPPPAVSGEEGPWDSRRQPLSPAADLARELSHINGGQNGHPHPRGRAWTTSPPTREG